MGIAQAVLMAGDLQPQRQTPMWEGYVGGNAGMYIPASDPNFANIYPGSQDFCWETWINPSEWYNQPATLVSWDMSNSGSGNFGVSLYPDSSGGAAGVVAFGFNILSNTSTQIATQTGIWNTWFHVAFSRIGTTLNLWAGGQLVAQLTGFTDPITYSGIGGNAHWLFTGPVGDRDQSFGNPIGGQFRNMRYTIGSGVYSNTSTITPPSLTADIPPLTGTQYIWWPTSTSQIGENTTYVPDYNGASWQFQQYNGSGVSTYPLLILLATPSNQQLLPSASQFGNIYNKGTWTNSGTAPNQPKLTSTGPTPLYGTTIGDFTSTGTDVNIKSTDSSMGYLSDGFLMYFWFYIPANITNECKSIFNVETANGFVLNIGRPGQGLDWLSISSFGGSELAYAPHIWARNAWNFVCVERWLGSGFAQVSAWAGANGDTIATNVNLTDTGANAFTFAAGGNVTIGCPTGSSVSSQMYFNQIMIFNAPFTNSQPAVYDPNATYIPIVAIPSQPSYLDLTTGFDFQGTNGSTNIQPIGP